jgi:hypothetical protein
LTNQSIGVKLNTQQQKGKIMFYVYFARGYTNEELIATCRTEEAARARADEECANGARDIQVFNQLGAVVYEPEDEGILFDEW